jgi:tetratricopeptide (TPR) repeat protein
VKALALAVLAVCSAVSAAALEPVVDARAAQMAYLRGMLAERRGAHAEALQAFEEALTHDPNSAFICREAAELSLEVGLADKAEQWAQRVVALQPKSASSFLLMGRVQWAVGKTEQAQAAFETALKLDPKSSETIYSLGSLLSAKDPAKARRLLTRFLEQNPAQATEAHFQLAKLDLQESRWTSAEKHLKRAIELDVDGDAIAARYALAQAYETRRATEAALAEYLKLAKLETLNTPLLNHIGQLHFTMGDYKRARERFQEAKNAQNDDPTANHWLALDAERQGDFAKAAEFLRASAAIKEEPALNMRLSYYLTQAGRLKEAVGVLEASRAHWPNNDQIAYFLALGYDDLKKPSESIKLLRQVVGLKPEFRDARYQLAVLLEKAGKMAEAEREFQILLAQKPDDASVLNYLGYTLIDRGEKLDEAEAYIRRAVAVEPKNAAYQDSLGWAHFKLGRSTEALRELRAALASLPNDETVWAHVGDAYAALGDKESAWIHWRRAEALATAQNPVPEKARRVEGDFSPEKLGSLALRYFRLSQDGLRKISGLCDLKGTVLGHSFSYRGMITFKDERLEIDLLGPLFNPIFRIRADAAGFTMDPLHIEGLDDDAVAEAARRLFSTARVYLSGALWAGEGKFKKGWRRRRVEIPGYSLEVDRKTWLVDAVSPRDAKDFELRLEDFGRYEGRFFPKRLVGEGKGYSVALEFDDVKLELEQVQP